MAKGISNLIAMVLVIFITVVAVGVVLQFGLPTIQSYQQTVAIGEAEKILDIFDNTIRQTASEGAGSFKKVRVTVSEGTYRVDTGADSLDYNVTLISDALPTGTVTQGNIQKIVSQKGGDTELLMRLQYTNIDLDGDLRISNGPHDVCFEKLSDNPTLVVRVTGC